MRTLSDGTKFADLTIEAMRTVQCMMECSEGHCIMCDHKSNTTSEYYEHVCPTVKTTEPDLF